MFAWWDQSAGLCCKASRWSGNGSKSAPVNSVKLWFTVLSESSVEYASRCVEVSAVLRTGWHHVMSVKQTGWYCIYACATQRCRPSSIFLAGGWLGASCRMRKCCDSCACAVSSPIHLVLQKLVGSATVESALAETETYVMPAVSSYFQGCLFILTIFRSRGFTSVRLCNKDVRFLLNACFY